MIWEDNNLDDAQSNNTITPILLYQDEALTEEQITKNTKDQKPRNHRPNIHLLLRQEQPYMIAKNQQLNRGRLPTRAFNHKAHYRRA